MICERPTGPYDPEISHLLREAGVIIDAQDNRPPLEIAYRLGVVSLSPDQLSEFGIDSRSAEV